MKLGSISYINSLPVDWGLLSGAVGKQAFEMITDVPARLNQRMISGDLSAGPVSAIWPALHPGAFYLLPELSISSHSGVQSVLLFSRMPLPAMAGRSIAVTSEGSSTPVLLEILCRRRYGFKPSFESRGGEAEARLVIGDRALIDSEKAVGEGWIVTDLAEEWRAWTGMGFVFAVWAVRRGMADAVPERVSQTWQAVQESRAWGDEHPDAILKEAGRRTGLAKDRLRAYFSGLSYDFGPELQEAYRTYRAYAAECGFIPNAMEPAFFNPAVAV